jgi:hypothetical protein
MAAGHAHSQGRQQDPDEGRKHALRAFWQMRVKQRQDAGEVIELLEELHFLHEASVRLVLGRGRVDKLEGDDSPILCDMHARQTVAFPPTPSSRAASKGRSSHRWWP